MEIRGKDFYDLIVVGAGPAGSMAGRKAGQLGLRTLLIEKEVFPRYKPCGGAVSERARSCLDFEIPRELQEREIFGARVHFQDKAMKEQKEYRLATLIKRSALDHYLLKRAEEKGIEVMMGKKVTHVQEKPDQVEVIAGDHVFRSQYVIIAEGSQGKLKRVIRRKASPAEQGVCMVTEIDQTQEHRKRFAQDAVDIHFGITSMGYGWIFPHRNYYSVGIGGLISKLPEPRKTMRNFLAANGFYGQYKFKSHLIPLGGIDGQLTSSRIVLAGDAAGFIDPFSGEGIAYAIKSGQIAAEVIYKILSRTDEHKLLESYEFICAQEIGQELKHALFLARMVHNSPQLLANFIVRNKNILGKYLDIFANRITYKEFLYWLVPRIPSSLFNI